MPKAAIYVRLSKEDREKTNKNDNSESIINQQIMLLSHCKKEGWSVYHIYNDEDFSGSDRERPEFNKMIRDAEEHKFDIVLCKTQSRFARDMEYVEKYIKTLFPIWGIRFVGLVDNADSENKSNKKSRQINSMVDQWMLEDLSENIKATLSSKRKQGLWVGAFAPFGYIKDPKNKNHLIIDKEAAEIVQHIFDLYLKGYGVNTLTKKLNEERIPNPSTYKKSKGQSFHGDCSDIWSPFSVQRILKNQVYIGNTVQGKTENISYKSSKKRIKPKADWDVVKNTHEAIIDTETFYLVQESMANNTRSTKTGKATIFANKVRCLRCGSSMRSQVTSHKRYYTCHTHFIAPAKCDGTYIFASVLEKAVLKEIRKLYESYIDDSVIETQLNFAKQSESQKERITKKISSINKELTKVKSRFKNLYYDKSDGLLSLEDFSVLSEDCKEQEKSLQKQLETLNNEIEKINQRQEHAENVKEIINEFKNIKELDRYTVQTLIDYIEVGGNRTDRVIQIHWNF